MLLACLYILCVIVIRCVCSYREPMVQTSEGWPTRYAWHNINDDHKLLGIFIGAIKPFPLMDDYWDL